MENQQTATRNPLGIRRKIIQNLEFSITKTPKGSQKEKLLKLLEMEWNLHCNICDNILKLIEKLDQFHLQVTNKLCEILNIEEKIVESTSGRAKIDRIGEKFDY